MQWKKTTIKLEDVPAIAAQAMEMAKAGNPLVEEIRCVFTLEDDPIYYMFVLVDYIDNIPDKKITNFFLYQKVAS